jgi:hypothetical protein
MPKLIKHIIKSAEQAIGHKVKIYSIPGTSEVCLKKNPREAKQLWQRISFSHGKVNVPCCQAFCGRFKSCERTWEEFLESWS